MSKYHYEVIGGYLRDPNPATLALLMAEDSAERIAKMVDGKWSYYAPTPSFDEGRDYKTAKGAKKRMDDWRQDRFNRHDRYHGIRWHCDMNPPECWREEGWRNDQWQEALHYSGIVLDFSECLTADIWKDKFPIVKILQMAAADLRKANPVSRHHLHVVKQAPADKDGICIVELGYEKDLVVTWSATSADAIHTARCLSQLYRKQTIAVYGRFSDGWEWRPLEWKGDTHWGWERSLRDNKPLRDLTWYGSDAIAKVEGLVELSAKIAEISAPEANLAEYNTVHDFLHQRLGAQLMQSLVNIGAVTTMLVPPVDGEPSLN